MKPNRYYCFPDIHGCSDVLKDALSFVYRNNPDGGKIIFLGDYIDRGPDNLGTIRTVMNPPENWEFICLMGNHEQMFLESYSRKEKFYNKSAAKDIAGFKQDEFVLYDDIHNKIPEDIIEWMSNLRYFHIEDRNVFAHAFYDDRSTPEDQNLDMCIWRRLADSERYWNEKQGLYLTHGHTPRQHGPVKALDRVNLDAGAVYYGRYVIAEYQKDIQGPIAFREFFTDK